MSEWVNIEANYVSPVIEYGVTVDPGGWDVLVDRYKDDREPSPFNTQTLFLEYEACPAASISREEGERLLRDHVRQNITPHIEDPEDYQVEICGEFMGEEV